MNEIYAAEFAFLDATSKKERMNERNCNKSKKGLC